MTAWMKMNKPSCTTIGLFVSVLAIIGCSAVTSKAPAEAATGTAVSSVRSYNGTASVGDFLTIKVDSSSNTIAYENRTNGQSGTVPYSINADGTYTVTDPQGNILTAYEVPGYAMVVEAAKAGSNQNTPALITAVESAPATILDFAGKDFNYIQFRTAAGGVEIGSVSIDAQGNIQHDGYFPMALIWGNGQYFGSGTIAASSITEDPSGNSFTINEQDSSKDVVFGTQNGLFAVDTGNGTILGLPKSTSKDFSAASAGTYKGIYYEKANAQTGGNNFEIGTPTQGSGTVTVAADGTITIKDSQNVIMATGTLVPVADSSYLYDGTANKLADPCFGLFTVRNATVNSQQDLFVSFQGNAVIFGSFQSTLPGNNGNPYTYFYGVGLK
jgi:hypothetical protein